MTAAFKGDMIQKNIGEATKRMDNQNHAIINHVIVERARPEDAAELLEFTKTIGAQTDNLTYWCRRNQSQCGAGSGLPQRLI